MTEPTPQQEELLADRLLDRQIDEHLQAKQDERRGLVPPPDDDGEREWTADEIEEAQLDRQLAAKENREAQEEADFNHRWRTP